MLSLEYKLVGTEGFINSGVQFRSRRVSDPPSEMNGYQADIGAGHSGCLYDESRRNKFLARCSDETIQRLEQPADWNRYEVRCEGAHIQICADRPMLNSAGVSISSYSFHPLRYSRLTYWVASGAF